jgi:hypothetical protein
MATEAFTEMLWNGILQEPLSNHEKFCAQRKLLSDLGMLGIGIMSLDFAWHSSNAKSIMLDALDYRFINSSSYVMLNSLKIMVVRI